MVRLQWKCAPPQAAIDEDTVNQVEAAILDDRSITVRKVADRVNISAGSVEKIIKEHLRMQKLSARWVLLCSHSFRKKPE